MTGYRPSCCGSTPPSLAGISSCHRAAVSNPPKLLSRLVVVPPSCCCFRCTVVAIIIIRAPTGRQGMQKGIERCVERRGAAVVAVGGGVSLSARREARKGRPGVCFSRKRWRRPGVLFVVIVTVEGQAWSCEGVRVGRRPTERVEAAHIFLRVLLCLCSECVARDRFGGR